MRNSRTAQKETIIRKLLDRYRTNPEAIRSCLPDIAGELDNISSSLGKDLYESRSHSYGPTELERERLRKSLLNLFATKNLSPDRAVQLLEYCATLIQDESLPRQIDRKAVMDVVGKAIKQPLSRIGKSSSFEIRPGEAVKQVSVLRGVLLKLTWNDRLVSVVINPARIKDRAKALRMVGAARDSSTDVARRHDAYIAETQSHAA